MTDVETKAGVPDGEVPDLTYAYKPSLMGAPWEFRLYADRLAWTIGPRVGSISFNDITRVRLSFRPVTMQSHRFLAEIWTTKTPKLTIASTSWRGMVEQERFDQPYRDFIFALHQRLAVANSNVRLETGTHPFLYWPGLAIFMLIGLSIAALLVRALQQESAAATLFLAAIFGLLLWQIGGFFRRNRPRSYSPDAIPQDVMPNVAKELAAKELAAK